MRPAWRWEHHLDLLPVSRRLWRGRFESCRLSCLEEEVCGFRRVGDIPGYAIPPLYVRFLKERRLSLLEPVMEHNVWDIASLAALAVSACRIIEGGETLDLEGGWDFAAAGKAFASLDVPDLSMECYREALNHDLPAEKRRAVLHGVGTFLKGEKRWEEAVDIWQQVRSEYGDDYLSRVELAKCFEHRLKVAILSVVVGCYVVGGTLQILGAAQGVEVEAVRQEAFANLERIYHAAERYFENPRFGPTGERMPCRTPRGWISVGLTASSSVPSSLMIGKILLRPWTKLMLSCPCSMAAKDPITTSATSQHTALLPVA